jgi:hypothetical protein
MSLCPESPSSSQTRAAKSQVCNHSLIYSIHKVFISQLQGWNIVFNLPIPGWLPGSSAHGEGDFGVKYTLAATARFMSLDADNSISSWSPFSALCAPFRPRFRSAETCKTIKLRRFINPPKAEAVEVPKINYLVNSSLSGTRRMTRVEYPAEVLGSIQVLVSVPEYVDLKGKEVPLSIRLRTKNLCEEECNKVQLTATSLDITQHEEFRCVFRDPTTTLILNP